MQVRRLSGLAVVGLLTSTAWAQWEGGSDGSNGTYSPAVTTQVDLGLAAAGDPVLGQFPADGPAPFAEFPEAAPAPISGFPAVAVAGTPTGNEIGYQGFLKQDGAPVNGLVDFKFYLFNAETGGSQVGSLVEKTIEVVNGQSAVNIDFGNGVFSEQPLWLEIAVRYPAGSGSFSTLSPRQLIAATPRSLSTRGVAVDVDGNVGIGTENPAEKLHVVGDVWTTGTLRVGNSVTIGGAPVGDPLGGDYVTASSGELDFQNTDIVVDANSRFGVGFNVPPPLRPAYRPETLFHARSHDLIDFQAALPLSEEESVIEAQTPWLGLYYEGNGDGGGGLGAGITLAKSYDSGNGDQIDKWAIFFRNSTSSLDMTYGNNIAAGAAAPFYDPMFTKLMSRILPNGNTFLSPVEGNVGVGPLIGAGLTPQAPLHVYWATADVDAPTAIFQKQRPGANYAVEIGGQRIDAVNMGGGTDPTFYLNLYHAGNVILAEGGGNVGIGTDAPDGRLDIHMDSVTTTPQLMLTETGADYARLSFSNTVNTARFWTMAGFTGAAATNDRLNLYHGGTGAAGNILTLTGDGNVGIGLTSTQGNAKLHVRKSNAGIVASDLSSNHEEVIIEDAGSAWLGLYSDNVGNVAAGLTFAEVGGDETHKWSIYSRTQDNVGDLVFAYTTNVNPTIPECVPLKLKQDGTVQVPVLEITGGCDLSEKFNVNSGDAAIEPGHVVSIDPQRPGELRVSSGAYDRTVAGIISGANGVNTGMIMGQSGSVADGKHPVALTGRVWTWCDASNGPIQPGDLLTTSDTPGYAMKVLDYPRAQGAIIGKAMTSLSEGNGLVLVLVSLQ